MSEADEHERLRALSEAVDAWLAHEQGASDDAVRERLRGRDAAARIIEDALRDPDGERSCGAPPDPPPPAAHPERIGRYRVVGELGGGGSAKVFAAIQDGTEQRVAVKVLQGVEFVPQRVARFQREARLAVQARADDVCRILDAGEHGGTPFLVFEHVDGESLHDLLARERGRPTTSVAARAQRFGPIVERCARALHAVHRSGVVHRDFKPANVMVGDGDRIKLLDFGVAVATEDDVGELTATGAVIGTPLYMAPEQLGDGRAVDRRADVYALGAVLYECLLLRPPITTRSRERLLQRIADGDIDDPRRIDPALSPKLAAVCLTALSTAAETRYADAAAFADDLAAALAGRPTAAHPPDAIERTVRFVRRHRWPVALVSAVVVGLLLWQLERGARRDAVDAVTSTVAALHTVLEAWEADRRPPPAAIDQVRAYLQSVPDLPPASADLATLRQRYQRELLAVLSDRHRAAAAAGILVAPAQPAGRRLALEVRLPRDAGAWRLEVFAAHSGDVVHTADVRVAGAVRLPALPPGRYSAELLPPDPGARLVQSPPRSGFTVLAAGDPPARRRDAPGDPAELRALALLSRGFADDALALLDGATGEVAASLRAWAQAQRGDVAAARAAR